jgi:CRP-like cAMP-binding protein
VTVRAERQRSLLDSLPEREIERLRAAAVKCGYRNRQAIFLKGDEAKGLFVVARGRVRIVANSAEGKEVILRVLEPGEIFGEVAMLDGGARTADAVADGDAELMYVGRADFLSFLEGNPRLCIDLLELVCGRLRSTSEQLEDFSFLDLRARLAKRLLQLVDEHGETEARGTHIAMALSQQTLAAMMGTSREAVNKQLRQWEDQGLIALGRNSITLVDREALERLVH